MKRTFRFMNNVITIGLVTVMLAGCSEDNRTILTEDESVMNDAENHRSIEAQKLAVGATGFIDYDKIDAIEAHNVSSIQEVYQGGIVPHHDVAYEMIDRFYKTLDKDQVEGVILIGPDHQGIGGHCSIAVYPFATYDGVSVMPKIEQIVNQDKVSVIPATMRLQEEEHSIGIHVNYIQHYYPDVPIVAIYVQDIGGIDEGEAVVDVLKDYVGDEHWLVIGTVDFSHYLQKEEADKKDDEMLEMIEHQRYDEIYRLGNDYLDSSSALYITYTLMKAMGYESPTVIEHDNSADIIGNKALSSTTSYYTIGIK